MSRSNQLITVGKLTFTVDEVEEILEAAVDMQTNVPHFLNPAVAITQISTLVQKVKHRHVMENDNVRSI